MNPPNIGINVGSMQPNQNGPYPPQQHQPYPPPYPPNNNGGPMYPQQQQPQYPPQQPFQAPIQTQPNVQYPMGGGGAQWYQNTDFAGYLRGAGSFHVKQSVELLEAVVGWESPNKFTIKDHSGNKVFLAVEESDMCSRQCCGARRGLTIRVRNMTGQDVLVFERGLDCSCCCALFCPDSMTVSTATGQVLGSIHEDFHIFNPSFTLKNAVGNPIFKIDGPACAFSICPGSSVSFKLSNVSNGAPVGTISKEWSGWARELFTDADYFSMSFPVDLDPSLKAVCLGALFLIDMEYFEHGHDGQQGWRKMFS